MKIALVTFDFDSEKHGGVSSVCFRIFESIRNEMKSHIEIISFSNSSRDTNSINILRPKSYKNNLKFQDGYFRGAPIIRIGAIGSEFEFMRYRKRRELTEFFSEFDLIIVVTGILQFANVIPHVNVPIFIQCATRLTWERKSQYREMQRSKKLLLGLQLPLLAFQEKRVLRLNATFLVENSRMQKWIKARAINAPMMWYPGVPARNMGALTSRTPRIKGHFISVGRLNESRKGWNRLFLAYKNAYDTVEKLPELIVVGAGSFSNETRKLLSSLVPNYPIKVLGELSDEERDLQICGASYFLQTSYEEGLGLAALEALRLGVPLICSATDGSREYVVEGVSGILVDQSPKFIENFGNAIIQSQDWNYAALHHNSLKLFYDKFEIQKSHNKLIQILSQQIVA